MPKKGSEDLVFPNVQAGDLKVALGPTTDGQTQLTITWREKTAMQEGTSNLFVTLQGLQDLLNNALAGTGVVTDPADPNYHPQLTAPNLTISSGAGQRPDAARVKLVPDSATSPTSQALEVTFYVRNQDLLDTIGPQTNIPTTDFSKANYVYGLEYMEEWRATWQRAIALAWSDPGPEQTSLKSQLLADPFHFLKMHCNYALPPTVELLVVDAKDVIDPQQAQNAAPESTCGFHPAKALKQVGLESLLEPDWSGPRWKWTLPRSVLIMFLPPPPDDPKNWAIALAAYEAVGKSYPFTMSS